MAGLRAIICHHEGAVLEGQMAVPDAPGPHPAVMVMHNAYGLGPHMRDVACRLAGEGYVALATDMYGGGVHHEDPKVAGSSIKLLWDNPDFLRSRVVAWYDLLKARAEVDAVRVAAIGYCFGGQCVLELARSGADAKAVISYHGLLTTARPAATGEVKGQVAIFTGAKDPYAPHDHVDAFRGEMIAAGARWQITEFGEAYHAFTDPGCDRIAVSGVAYDPLADKVSWAGTLALLRAILMGD
jgi:dienelactone hydrolase